MKKLAILMSTALLIPGFAVAQQGINNLREKNIPDNSNLPVAREVDSDAKVFCNYSLADVQVAYPNTTQAVWDRADKNNDDVLTGAELLEAIGEGMFAD